LNCHKNKRRVLFKTNRAAKKWCQDIVLKHRVPKEWRHPNFPIK
jgi:tRNA A-37 threonylcarbamoyl transferase component Bud32